MTRIFRILKWESVKKKAIDEFFARTQPGNIDASHMFLAMQEACFMSPPRKPLEVLEEWRDYGEQMIKNWDVRMAKKLIELFPSAVPRHLAKQPLLVQTDVDDNWVLCFGKD